MNFLLLWGGTTILSISIEILNEVRITKILAEKGYKVEEGKLLIVSDYLTTDIDMVSMILPVINIIHSLVRTIETFEFKNVKNEDIEKLYYIIPLTEEEKRQYEESFLNKIKNKFKRKKIDDDATAVIKYMEGNEENTIYFKEMEGQYILVKSEGPIANLSKENQQEKLQQEMNDLNLNSSNQIEQLKHLRETFVDSDEITKERQKEKTL